MARNIRHEIGSSYIKLNCLFLPVFLFFNDKGGKIEDEKGARKKHSCVRRKVLIILP